MLDSVGRENSHVPASSRETGMQLQWRVIGTKEADGSKFDSWNRRMPKEKFKEHRGRHDDNLPVESVSSTIYWSESSRKQIDTDGIATFVSDTSYFKMLKMLLT